MHNKKGIVGKMENQIVLIAWKAVDCQIAELTADERTIYMEDINRIACAMHEIFHPDKVNYGA